MSFLPLCGDLFQQLHHGQDGLAGDFGGRDALADTVHEVREFAMEHAGGREVDAGWDLERFSGVKDTRGFVKLVGG